MAAQDDEVAVFFDRFFERLNDGLPGGIRLHVAMISAITQFKLSKTFQIQLA